METPILLTIIASAVAIVGWIVNHIFSSYRDESKERVIASLKYTERQLEELYGPLAIQLLEGRRIWEDLLDKLGRRYVFVAGQQLPADEMALWLFWIENDSLPRNDRIKQLLMAKTHLIEGETVPRSYLLFLEHANSWHFDHLRWQKERIEYSFHSKINWPTEFEEDILVTFEDLKSRHFRFLREIGRTRGPSHLGSTRLHLPLRRDSSTPAAWDR